MITSPKSDQQPALTPEPAPRPEQFIWNQHWYPVAVAEFLDPKRPHPIQVLGLDLVLWRDAQGLWHCFEDACPHRLAPFSEGRVEADGTLLCAYHAWRFNGEGACVKIPQCETPEKEARACANPKSRAIVFPTQERQGLIWVWPDASETALHDSHDRSPAVIPELEDNPDHLIKGAWNIRDLPYGWDFFMENVADPAHVPVSHHGLVGDRYRDAKYYTMTSSRPISTQEGFAFDITPTAPTVSQASHSFHPPCLMRIQTTFVDGGGLLLVLYAIPSRPGWCRHIGRQVLIKNMAGKTPQGLAFFGLPMPTWMTHVLASLFLHQDLVFLHYQQQRFQTRPGRWLEEVYTPNPQDKMVLTFRQWLTYRAGGGIGWHGTPDDRPTTLGGNCTDRPSRADLFDVWHTHTEHCHVCQQALKGIRRWMWSLWVLAVVLLLGAIGVAANPNLSSSNLVLGLGITAILLGISGALLHRFSQLFYHYAFHHADND